MRTTPKNPRPRKSETDELESEYRIDYTKAKPNRFAARYRTAPVVVMLEQDVAKVFKDSESVNRALRALIGAVPRASKSKGR